MKSILGILASLGLCALVLPPLVALVLSCFATGVAPRSWSLLPSAVAISDPFIWKCVGNSLVEAILVAIVSRFLGMGLARAIASQGRRRIDLLPALALAPLALSPALLCLGALPLVPWFEGLSRTIDQGFVHRIFAFLATSKLPHEELGRWSSAVVVHSIWGVSVAAGLVARALREMNPLWEDSARVLGANRSQAWKSVVLPTLRPNAARAFSLVFCWVLVDPGAAIVLGLRRSLAFQIMLHARESQSLPGAVARCAFLSVAAWFCAWAVSSLAGWHGRAANQHVPELISLPGPALRQARSRLGALVLLAWSIVAWTPLLIIVRSARLAIAGASGETFAKAEANHVLALAQRLRDSTLGFGSWEALILLGTTTAALAATALALASRAQWPFRSSPLDRFVRSIPPVSFGVGVGLLAMAFDGRTQGVGRSFDLSFVFQGWAAVASWLPWLSVCGETRKTPATSARREAALVLGVPKGRYRVGWRGDRLVSIGVVVLSGLTSVAPMIGLVYFEGANAIGPSTLALGAGDLGEHQLASVVVCIYFVANAVLLLAAKLFRLPAMDRPIAL